MYSNIIISEYLVVVVVVNRICCAVTWAKSSVCIILNFGIWIGVIHFAKFAEVWCLVWEECQTGELLPAVKGSQGQRMFRSCIPREGWGKKMKSANLPLAGTAVCLYVKFYIQYIYRVMKVSGKIALDSNAIFTRNTMVFLCTMWSMPVALKLLSQRFVGCYFLSQRFYQPCQ